ncbi:hypothetical protein SARC_03676 [Sphaeroforma arctica JP610]|uniref:FAD-binding PCMH-type domain-containing protein n=1 Tax=Sphaeroforma arctica JP610 TaxID=667725 RepID=A0A0L0G7A5_9EUKA|nr:hypothetical protein SARC_03676 [Sphaeroforma arctica JP610]KNC84083.1 hypothetical protein SARC_03676 [Sphaeroforma arctica JP610]|eukprot:XP_014157985.1 hypothetical protein SARC_03676 [Sphaeroforma arctica JP610]
MVSVLVWGLYLSAACAVTVCDASITPRTQVNSQERLVTPQTNTSVNFDDILYPIRGRVFRDWDQRHVCYPAEFYYPRSVDDIVAIVKENNNANAHRQIKVVGAGHSFSPIMIADDRNAIMMSLDKVNKFLSPTMEAMDEYTEGDQLVTVESGMRLWELNENLIHLGLAMENLGAITEQSVAGAFSTSTHGTGGSLGSLATAVRGIKFVSANGTLVSASIDSNPELFHAVVVGLGAIGVVVEVTLKVQPAYKLYRSQTKWDLDELIHELPVLLQRYERLQWYWTPYVSGENAVLLTREATDKAIEPAGMGCWNGTKVVTPTCVDISNRVLSRDGRAGTLFTEMEQFIPIAHCMDALNDFRAFQEMPEVVAAYNPKDKLFTGVRYVAADKHWMSMMYESDICVISFIAWGNTHESGDSNVFKFYAQELERISHRYGGRPHWGKMNWGTRAYFRTVYPRLDDFVQLQRSMDPNGIFMNQYLRERLH